jgi:hypothetical protein
MEAEAMAMKRPEPAAGTAGGSSVRDDVLHGWLPSLHDHLTESSWDDGKPRKTSTLMLLVENGVWKAWLHDRDRKMNAWVSGEGWEGLLEAVERALSLQTLEWRKDTR